MADAPRVFAPPAPAADDLVYVGSSRGLEVGLIPRTGIRSYFIPMAAPSSPRGALLAAGALLRSLVLLARERPDVTLATGGYVCVPVAFASWLLRRPVVLFLPDVVPGKAVAALAPLARKIAVSNEDAAAHFPAAKTEVTGYPLREWFRATSRTEARARLRLPANAQVLCVFGGSQGSRSINTALAAHLPALLDRCHVVHIAGEQRLPEAEAAAARLTAGQRDRYHLVPYLHDQSMADALAAADLVLCRSGASTLGELPAAGVPAVLVPLPEAKVHQKENAEYLARQGAAAIIPDGELPSRLGPAVTGLLDHPEKLAAMAGAMRALDRPEAAERVAEIVRAVAAS